MENILLKLLDLAFDKRSWHGANLMSDWVKRPRPGSEKQWKEDVQMLRGLHERLKEVVRKRGGRFDEKELWLVQGAAFHDIYHAGQIKLLRRMMR